MRRVFFAILIASMALGSFLGLSDRYTSLFDKLTPSDRIDVTFENKDDIDTFEKRLDAFNVKFTQLENNDDTVSYRVKHNNANDHIFDLVCKNYEFSLTDVNDNPIAIKEQVCLVDFDGYFLEVVVSSDFAKEFDDEYVGHSMYFNIDGTAYSVDAIVRDCTITFGYGYYKDTAPECLRLAAIALVADDLQGTVDIKHTSD